MLAFTNDQIETPYNSTIKSERSHLEGIRKAACNLPLLLYQCLRRDVLAYVVPCSLALEKVSLLLPEAGLGMMRGLSPIPTLSSTQIKKKEGWAGDERPTQRQSCVG